MPVVETAAAPAAPREIAPESDSDLADPFDGDAEGTLAAYLSAVPTGVWTPWKTCFFDVMRDARGFTADDLKWAAKAMLTAGQIETFGEGETRVIRAKASISPEEGRDILRSFGSANARGSIEALDATIARIEVLIGKPVPIVHPGLLQLRERRRTQAAAAAAVGGGDGEL